MRTERQRRGTDGEEIALRWLQARQWRVIARNVRIGKHDEIDVVAVDPGPPSEVVCVEVRSARSLAYGAPEERLGRQKVGHMYRAALALSRSAELRKLGVGGLPVRVDLLVVDRREPRCEVRQLKRLEPA